MSARLVSYKSTDDPPIDNLTPPSSCASEDANEENYESRAAKTHWKEIYIISAFYFFAYVTYQALNIPLFNYLKELDSGSAAKMYGPINSAYKAFHAISILCFAIITFVTKKYRNNLIIGRVIALVGLLLYLLVEVFPVSVRSYVVLVVFILEAVGEGSIGTVRSYVPRISTPEDRTAALGIKNIGVLASIIAGPLIMFIFTILPYPTGGLMIIPSWLRITQSTGVIWVLLLFNIGILYCACCHIKEPSEMEGEQEDQAVPLMPSLRKAWRHFQTVDRPLIIMCMIEKGISGGGVTGMLTIFSPYISATFNTPPATAVGILSFGTMCCGVVACLTTMLFIFGNLGSRVPSSRLYPIALITLLILFIISFPYSFIAEKVVVWNNVTAPYGCKSYRWCGEAYIMPKYFWLTATTLLLGVSFPFSIISQDTIYSRVLEGMDQNIMQAVYMVAEDVVLFASPLVSMELFRRFSPASLWVVLALFMAVGLVLWIPVYRKLRRIGI